MAGGKGTCTLRRTRPQDSFLGVPVMWKRDTVALLEPRDWNQGRWIKGSRRREGENEDWAQGANTLYDRTVNLRLPSCRTARSSLEAGSQWIVLLTFGKPHSTILRAIRAPSKTSLPWTTAWVTISETHYLLIPLSCPVERPLNYTQVGPLLSVFSTGWS